MFYTILFLQWLITLAKYTTKLVIWPLLFLTEQVYESYTKDQSGNTNLENYNTCFHHVFMMLVSYILLSGQKQY